MSDPLYDLASVQTSEDCYFAFAVYCIEPAGGSCAMIAKMQRSRGDLFPSHSNEHVDNHIKQAMGSFCSFGPSLILSCYASAGLGFVWEEERESCMMRTVTIVGQEGT